ncbi:MAG: hypothetical protein HEEMFOPI_00256 [Holosporales bacterium]
MSIKNSIYILAISLISVSFSFSRYSSDEVKTRLNEAIPKSGNIFDKCPQSLGEKINWRGVKDVAENADNKSDAQDLITKLLEERVISCIKKNQKNFIKGLTTTCKNKTGSADQISVCKEIDIDLSNQGPVASTLGASLGIKKSPFAPLNSTTVSVNNNNGPSSGIRKSPFAPLNLASSDNNSGSSSGIRKSPFAPLNLASSDNNNSGSSSGIRKSPFGISTVNGSPSQRSPFGLTKKSLPLISQSNDTNNDSLPLISEQVQDTAPAPVEEPIVEQVENSAPAQIEDTPPQSNLNVDEINAKIEEYKAAIEQYNLVIQQYQDAINQYNVAAAEAQNTIDQANTAKTQYESALAQVKDYYEQLQQYAQQLQQQSQNSLGIDQVDQSQEYNTY